MAAAALAKAETPRRLLRRTGRGAAGGNLPSPGSFFSYCSSSRSSTRPSPSAPSPPLSGIIATLFGYRRPSQAAAFFRRVISGRRLGLPARTGLYSAVIHVLVGARLHAQAICLTKELVQEYLEAGRRDQLGRHVGQITFEALQGFDDSDKFSAAAFGVLVIALSQSGLVDEASWVFHQLSDLPAVHACNALLDGLLKAGRIGSLWELHADMLGRGLEPSSVTYNTLINACRWQGDPSRALQLLDEMVGKGLEPTVVTYTTVVCGLCEEGRIPEAMDLFRNMRRSGVLPNVYTYTAMMDGQCKLADTRGALVLYETMLGDGLLPNAVTLSTLANGLCKEGRTREARELLCNMIRRHVEPNAFAYNCLIDGHAKFGGLSEAFKLQSLMARTGAAPDVVTYGTLMKGLCDAGMVQQGRELLQQMRQEGVAPNTIVYNTLIEGYCKLGDTEEAAHVCSEMTGEGVEPNVVTFSLLIDAHCKTGEMDTAMGIFSEMAVRGVVPDVVTYTCLIDGHMKKGNLEEACRLNKEMADAGEAANVFTLCTLIDGLCRQGRSREAMQLFLQNMGVHDGGSGRNPGRAWSVDIHPPCSPNSIAYMALIYGLYRDAQHFKAGRFFALMRESGMVPDVSTYAALMRGQCQFRYLLNAMMLHADMLKAGVMPVDGRGIG
ncbi:hypothetical protein Taro_016366 [Colocasia esculenta]|uniref:Pentatricopeptide repeat-containing protein n=1 Tax=Colocasia esculenta TaxID=4460 RepID=A0A843USQ3_COLES|nr:hypothetical protein [Colocasia esculenta]